MSTKSLAVSLRPNAGHGLLILEVFRSHITAHHSRQDSSGRVISSSLGPLPDNTQNSQQKNIHAPVGFELKISAGERPQTYALDGVATGTGILLSHKNSKYVKKIKNISTTQFYTQFKNLFFFHIPHVISAIEVHGSDNRQAKYTAFLSGSVLKINKSDEQILFQFCIYVIQPLTL